MVKVVVWRGVRNTAHAAKIVTMLALLLGRVPQKSGSIMQNPEMFTDWARRDGRPPRKCSSSLLFCCSVRASCALWHPGCIHSLGGKLTCCMAVLTELCSAIVVHYGVGLGMCCPDSSRSRKSIAIIYRAVCVAVRVAVRVAVHSQLSTASCPHTRKSQKYIV